MILYSVQGLDGVYHQIRPGAAHFIRIKKKDLE